jgi:hypothetical protein
VLTLWPIIWLWRTYSETKDVLKFPDVTTSFKVSYFLRIAGEEFVWLALVLMCVYAFTVFVIRKKGLACEHTLTLGDAALIEKTDVNKLEKVYTELRTMKKQCGFWLVRGITGTMFVFKDSGILEGNIFEFSREFDEKVKAARK